MARSAVLTGRSFADVIYNAGILVVLMISGWFVGWTVRTDVLQFLAGVGLLLLFAFAMSWIGIWLGLSVPSVEVGQQVSFIVIFPITFISNAFVPIGTMPSWLQPFAEWNPVSTLTASVRTLWGNPNPFATDNLPSQQPILVTLLWVAVILVVFVPMGVRKYRSVSRGEARAAGSGAGGRAPADPGSPVGEIQHQHRDQIGEPRDDLEGRGR
jgi:ABC-type multidrug transport system permease subunit